MKHPSEHPRDTCRRCGVGWCSDCLVYVFGAEQPPFCLGCALVVSGVRTHGMPAMSRRQIRARKRAERLADREARRHQGAPAPSPPPPEPARPVVDWSTPWWEAAPAD